MAGRWIGLGCVLLVAVGAGIYFFWPTKRDDVAGTQAGAGMVPSQSGDNSALTDNGEVKVPAVVWRGNTVAADAFADKPEFAATLVTLDLQDTDAQTGLRTLAEAANLRFVRLRGSPVRRGEDLVNLTVDRMPLLEAMLEFEAQSGTDLRPNPDGALSGAYRGDMAVPGEWSVTGGFGFVIRNISHSVTLGRDGQPKPAFADEPAEFLFLDMISVSEPKIHVLQYPGMLRVKEAVDENGHSLELTGVKPGMARYAQPLSTTPDLRVALSYPAAEAGRTIKHFSATGDFVVQGKSETLSIDDPMSAAASEKSFGGISAAVSKMEWVPGTTQFKLHVVYRRGSADLETWKTFADSLGGSRPQATGDGAVRLVPLSTMPPQERGESVAVDYQVKAFAKGVPRPTLIDPPALSNISVEIPTSMETVTVPVEFHDLRLP